MNYKAFFAFAVFLFTGITFFKSYGTLTNKKSRNFDYPQVRREESVIDDYHGTKVSDPYRWLEDPDSDETKQFIEAENKFSQSYLTDDNKSHIINEMLTSLWNYAKYDTPKRHGKYYFTSMNSGLQNHKIVYKQSTLDEEPRVFLDVNSLSRHGTISLEGTSFSKDGSLLAYSLSESGSDWTKILIRNAETGVDYAEVLQRVKYSTISWTHDNVGFFYCRYDQEKQEDGFHRASNMNQKLYYHRVGEAQENDVLVVEFPEHPIWRMLSVMSDDGKYLILSVLVEYNAISLYYFDLDQYHEINGKISLTPIVTKFDYNYIFIANIGSKMVFLTNKHAPNNRLITIDVDNNSEENWQTLVEEDPKDVLMWAQVVDNDKIVAGYLHDVKTEMRVYSLDTGKFIRKFTLEIGTIVQFSGCQSSSEVFYKLESFLTPGTIYRYDFSTPEIESSIYRESNLNLDGFNKNNFTVEQVFYPSNDGTLIPMFIIQKKTQTPGLKPTLLHGYGGFGIPQVPSFDERFLFFVNNFDGILAIANIRGGGEYGEKWHNSGRLLNKQTTFTDFQAAAEYLIKQNYTESKKLGILGISNGGLLIGACINQRPDLFGVAVIQVGTLDIVRFTKFTAKAGAAEYGDPDHKVQFENLYTFSPLHNVNAPNNTNHQYPVTFILTADHDDRIKPLHSLKFAATLQHELGNNEFQQNPVLLKVYNGVGHGAGKPTAKQIEEATDIIIFLYRTLHIDDDIRL